MTTQAHALRYAAAGFSVIPLKPKSKEPIQKAWPTRPTMTAADIERTWKADYNIGIRCGAPSGNLAGIDFDSWDDFYAFQDAYPVLANTYRVQSGSGRGVHVYLRSRAPLPPIMQVKTAHGIIDFQSDGRQIVAPPSIHPVTGQAYTVHHYADVRIVDNLDSVVAWMEAQRIVKPPKAQPDRPRRQQRQQADGTVERIRNPRAYFNAMLDRHHADMSALPEGERWRRFGEFALPLYSAAQRLNMPRQDVDRCIVDAYAKNGYSGDHDDLVSMMERAYAEADPALCALEIETAVSNGQLDTAPDQDADAAPRYFANGLPDSWRAAANRAKINSAALDMLYAYCAAHQTDRFTLDDLKAFNLSAGYGIAKSTLHDFLNSFFGAIVRKLPIESFSTKGKFRTDTANGFTWGVETRETVQAYLMTCVQNRLYEEYHPTDDTPQASAILATPTPRMMESIEADPEAAAALDSAYQDIYDLFADERFTASKRLTWEVQYWRRALRDTHSTPLPSDAPRHSAATFTRSLARQIVPTGQRISKSKIARLLGVSPRTAYSVLKDAGLKAIDSPVPAQPVASIIEAKVYAKQHAAKIMNLRAYHPDRSTAEFRLEDFQPAERDSAADGFIRDQHARGATVFVELAAPKMYERVERPEIEAAPVPEPQDKPKSTDRAAATTESTSYAPHLYNPAWVYGQLKLAVSLVQGRRYQWREGDLIDTRPGSGVKHETPTAAVLIALILDKPLPAVNLHPLIVEGVKLGATISTSPVKGQRVS